MSARTNERLMHEAQATDVFEVVPGPLDANLILVCDHASNALPERYGSLGLPLEQLERHIGYDIGAAAVTRGLAAALGVPAVLSRYSRLLIDLNRGLDDPTLIMRLSDGAIIPGNCNVDAAERAQRIELYYKPYHDALERTIERALAAGHKPALFSVHSFTPVWKGQDRPWDIGVAWDDDARLAPHLIKALQGLGIWRVGDNEPYHGGYEGDCLWTHAKSRGLATALIEMRQDLVATPAGQQVFIDGLAQVLTGLLAQPQIIASFAQPNGQLSGVQAATELEAQAFRRLLAHLNERSDVQNIDLMNLAGFCRNCLAKWYAEAAAKTGLDLSKDEARHIVYGMPYREWADKYQREALPDAKAKFAQSAAPHR